MDRNGKSELYFSYGARGQELIKCLRTKKSKLSLETKGISVVPIYTNFFKPEKAGEVKGSKALVVRANQIWGHSIIIELDGSKLPPVFSRRVQDSQMLAWERKQNSEPDGLLSDS